MPDHGREANLFSLNRSDNSGMLIGMLHVFGVGVGYPKPLWKLRIGLARLMKHSLPEASLTLRNTLP